MYSITTPRFMYSDSDSKHAGHLLFLFLSAMVFSSSSMNSYHGKDQTKISFRDDHSRGFIIHSIQNTILEDMTVHISDTGVCTKEQAMQLLVTALSKANALPDIGNLFS